MKKIVTVLTLSFSALLLANTVPAAPFAHELQEQDSRERSERSRGMDRRAQHQLNADQDFQDRHRFKEERGVKRLRQHKWQTGFVMPQHYRGNSYKTEYKDYNLPKPGRNQQWYKINNDFILVDEESHNILKVQKN